MVGIKYIDMLGFGSITLTPCKPPVRMRSQISVSSVGHQTTLIQWRQQNTLTLIRCTLGSGCGPGLVIASL